MNTRNSGIFVKNMVIEQLVFCSLNSTTNPGSTIFKFSHTFFLTSESKKPRQITVVITTVICLGFFDSDVRKKVCENLKIVDPGLVVEFNEQNTSCSITIFFTKIPEFRVFTILYH